MRCEGVGKRAAQVVGGVDRLMERASAALEKMHYFEAERLALRALVRAHGRFDFERMSRIVLPLQEARRQKRQLAVESGWRALLASMAELGAAREVPMPGCYLLQPPLIAADARGLREAADAAGVPVLVVTREPLTLEGKWPVVAVGPGAAGGVSVRARVDPPVSLERVEGRVTKDSYGQGWELPRAEWFEGAAEAMGDAAIAKLRAEDPAAWRVEELMEYLDAHPDHEKLHQRLEENCRLAMMEPLPEGRRRRPMVDDPYSF